MFPCLGLALVLSRWHANDPRLTRAPCLGSDESYGLSNVLATHNMATRIDNTMLLKSATMFSLLHTSRFNEFLQRIGLIVHVSWQKVE